MTTITTRSVLALLAISAWGCAAEVVAEETWECSSAAAHDQASTICNVFRDKRIDSRGGSDEVDPLETATVEPRPFLEEELIVTTSLEEWYPTLPSSIEDDRSPSPEPDPDAACTELLHHAVLGWQCLVETVSGGEEDPSLRVCVYETCPTD